MRIRMLLACLLVVVTAGCSSDDEPAPKKSPEASATASAAGVTIKGTGYAYQAPEGWAVPSQKPAGFDFDSLSAETRPGDPAFARNLNVVRASSKGRVSLDAIEKGSLDQLRSTVGNGIDRCPRTRVEDVHAACFTGPATFGKTRYFIVQLAAPTDTALYTLTFSFSPKDSPAERDDVVLAVLGTWHWS